MDRETRAKIEKLAESYETRILVLVTVMAIAIFSAASLFTLKIFSSDYFDPAKGDRPLISYQVIYYGQQFTQVATWADKDGNHHFAKEPARFAGIDVSVLVLALFNLGIAKGAYDFYRMLTGRHKRRLMAGGVYGIRVEKA